MSDIRDQRRRMRATILSALKDETGSAGGAPAAARVNAYIKKPLDASTEDFAFVGALTLTRFFIDPSKPDASERRGLWQNIMSRIESDQKDAGGWGGSTNVAQLQAIVEEAVGDSGDGS